MSNPIHPQLDLTGKIRPGLDILANEIVIALKKRSRFPVNASVYIPGLVISAPDQSLLEHVLSKIERVHAQLGRYTFAAQDAYTSVSSIAPIIQRDAPESPLHPMKGSVGHSIIQYYRKWIHRACTPGDDTDTYGETVTSDVDALLAIMERVNLGRSVAEAKFLEQPEAFRATRGERNGLLGLLVKPEREVQVLEIAERLGERYALEVEHTVDVFRFMITTTIEIEIDYLRLRIDTLPESN